MFFQLYDGISGNQTMKLQISKNANVNYLSKVVDIQEFVKHPDPKVERIKCAVIDGFIITVGIDSEPGLYVYFPVLSQINPQLLQYLNLYRNKEKNKDPEKTGYFEDKGIVKAINLRGVKSEGFLMPISDLQNFVVDTVNVALEDLIPNTEFDEVEHNGKTFWVSKKYVAPVQKTPGMPGSSKERKKHKGLDKIIDEQFRFHYDTTLIKKCPHVIKPNDLIHISSKWHGTSGISAYVLCHKHLTLRERIAKWLTGNPFDIYDYVYSSRTVIKNRFYNEKVTDGFYGCDVWKYADDYIKPFLIKGMTIYYEIVGYLPNGGWIQKNYDYGCVPPTVFDNGQVQYVQGKNFKVLVYRITLTNVDGQVHEFSAREVQTWCKNRNILCALEYYYGKASSLYPELMIKENWEEDWSNKFLNALANDKRFNMEQNSPECDNKVPHEGLVIKIENMKSEAFKLKCFKFLGLEQDEALAGEGNIEDNS